MEENMNSLIRGNPRCCGLGFRPSTVQAALGLVIVLLVSLYGRERHMSATI
jgi:ribose transport system permease protein